MQSQVKQNLQNSISQMKKGFLEMLVLKITSKKPVYVFEILEELKKADLEIVEGTMYPLLNRLKREGLLEYDWEESTSGPPRKYYKLSGGGEEYLQKLITARSQIEKKLKLILDDKN
jgi:PadR family transcriptional regulator PadR